MVLHASHWEPGLQPRHVPWLGIEPAIFWIAGQCSVLWATPTKVPSTFLEFFPHRRESCFDRRWFSPIPLPWLPPSSRRSWASSDGNNSSICTAGDTSSQFPGSAFALWLIVSEAATCTFGVILAASEVAVGASESLLNCKISDSTDAYSVWRWSLCPTTMSFILFLSHSFLDIFSVFYTFIYFFHTHFLLSRIHTQKSEYKCVKNL